MEIKITRIHHLADEMIHEFLLTSHAVSFSVDSIKTLGLGLGLAFGLGLGLGLES